MISTKKGGGGRDGFQKDDPFDGAASETSRSVPERGALERSVPAQSVFEPDKACGSLSSVRLVDFLHFVMDDARLHSLWLNTLSFLEYIGARKIAKALPQEAFNEALLEHLSEETQHSLYFKRLARKARHCRERKNPSFEKSESGDFKSPGFKEEELLDMRAARDYFQALDNKAKAQAGGSVVFNYLLTSCAVERRAIALYSVYNRLLKKRRFPFTLDPVLKDEKKHLAAMQARIEQLKHQDRLSALIRYEETLFPILVRRLFREAESLRLSCLEKPHAAPATPI